MTRVSTQFGEPLSAESKKLVNEVRLRINQPIHPQFDTNFNIYRFIMNVERTHKKEKDIIELATKGLNNHLRQRRAFKLDTMPVKTFDENPVFQRRLMPRGEVQTEMVDSSNRLMWYIDYASVTVESLAHSTRSSEAVRYQFWQFEYMLRLVMAHEEKTGRLSSLHHIIDMAGYEINPFTMLFVTSGTLAYYSQLFHYENFPELVSPGSMVNIAKWIHVPYKLCRAVMPAGFADRFQLQDSSFMVELQKQVKLDQIPVSLGGTNTEIQCTPAVKVPPENYWAPSDEALLASLEAIHVPARKRRHVKLDVAEAGQKISWYFRTDGDIFFGVFYEATPSSSREIESGVSKKDKEKECKELETDDLEMVYPYVKLTAKIVHEWDSIIAEQPGRYYVVWCNNHSWLTKRAVEQLVHLDVADGKTKRVHFDGTLSPAKQTIPPCA